MSFRALQLAPQIDKAIEGVAKRQGVSRDDLEDLAVPTYGLDAEGNRNQSDSGQLAPRVRPLAPWVRIEGVSDHGLYANKIGAA